MQRIERRAQPNSEPQDSLTLRYDERKRSRLRTRSDAGVDVAIVFARGSVLRHGDRLLDDAGRVYAVFAAVESVSDASTSEPLLLARAAYHLGNRHVPLQIAVGTLRYQHDHVLDDMLRELGLDVCEQLAAFEPESGAYAQAQLGAASRAHAHAEPVHSHAHDHDDHEPHHHHRHEHPHEHR